MHIYCLKHFIHPGIVGKVVLFVVLLAGSEARGCVARVSI